MEYVKLKKLLENKIIFTISPTYKLKNDEIFESGKTAVISQDKEKVIGYSSLVDNKLINPPYLLFGDHTEIFKWCKTNFIQGADGLKIIDSKDKKFLAFLYYALKACYYPSGFYERHYSKLVKTKIPVMATEERNKLLKILSAYDKLIENNDKRIAILEQEAEELYKEWFVRFRFPGYENLDFENGIPATWNLQKIEDLIKQRKDKLKHWNGLNILDLANMPSFSWNISSSTNGEDFQTNIYHLNKLDLVFGSIRTYLGKGGFSPFDGGVAGTVFNFISTNECCYCFLLCLITSKTFFEYTNTVSKGTKMPIIDFKDIQNFKTYIPSNLDIFKKFNKLVMPLVKHIDLLISENKKLTQQRDYLLPRLMSGKLGV